MTQIISNQRRFRLDQIHRRLYTKINALYHRVNRASKIGRNYLCPCGSGMKWKKCHIANYKSDRFRLNRLMWALGTLRRKITGLGLSYGL